MTFDKLAQATTARAARRGWVLATAVVVAWAASGPVFGFNDTLPLVINTGTTIVTFLMVFLIQDTRNRDTDAMQVKPDELNRVTDGARLALLNREEKADQLDRIRDGFLELGRRHRDEGGLPQEGGR